MRVKLRVKEIYDVDGMIYKLSEMGIGVSKIYRQLAEGKNKNLEFYVEEDKVKDVSSAIKELCQFEVIYEEEENKWLPLLLLGILWLDTTILYFLLKLSFLSDEFNYLLSYFLASGKMVAFTKALVSMLAILVYYSGFILVRGTTPVGMLFGLKIEKEHFYAIVLFSLPLISFYLLQFNITIVKIFGLLALSFCVVMPFYLKESIKS